MNNDDWLAKLAPAQAPEAIGWWPPAYGWWLMIAATLLLTTAALLYLLRARYHLKSAAIRTLNTYRAIDDDRDYAKHIEHLLRRFAMSKFSRYEVARLQGEYWLRFMITRGGVDFDGEAGKHFLRMIYDGRATAYRQAWFSGAKQFIKKA